jgi:xanthine dehydrogenase molybdopterin-binding subunit B
MSASTPAGPKSAARVYTHPGLPEPADKDYAVIGKSKPKIDAREKVTGQARYTADLKFPNMLYGKILTSPHAHARILSIDTSEAETIPGVKAVITHKDVPTLKYGISPARWDENIFCIDTVKFVGDKVAAVACIDEETCYKALKAIKVDYEVLPAVLDPLHAMTKRSGRPTTCVPTSSSATAPIRRRWNRIPPPPSGRTANSPSTPAPSRPITSSTTSPASSNCPWATCAS